MTIGLVGIGYVGLPLAVALAEAGLDVVCVDVDPRKVEALRCGRSYVEDVESERLAAVCDRIEATMARALNDHAKPVRGSKVAVLGVA